MPLQGKRLVLNFYILYIALGKFNGDFIATFLETFLAEFENKCTSFPLMLGRSWTYRWCLWAFSALNDPSWTFCAYSFTVKAVILDSWCKQQRVCVLCFSKTITGDKMCCNNWNVKLFFFFAYHRIRQLNIFYLSVQKLLHREETFLLHFSRHASEHILAFPGIIHILWVLGKPSSKMITRLIKQTNREGKHISLDYSISLKENKAGEKQGMEESEFATKWQQQLSSLKSTTDRPNQK